jgi:hypothetical protein
MKWVYCLGILALLLVSGCYSLSEEAAEAKAIQFVKDRVKFYTRDNNSNVDFPSYSFYKVNSYEKGDNWVVIVQIVRQENTSKKTDVVVELDKRSGKAVLFNNQPVVNE